MRLGFLALLIICGLAASFETASTQAPEGWVINRFHADIKIDQGGDITVMETLDVDWKALERHGIFRDIPLRYE